jgi:threonine dehydrogenase-like Zn-dependent dehydrogenase
VKGLFYLGPGQLEWRDTPEPELLTASDALVRPITVATCDLDMALIHGDAPFPGPFPLGHEGVCEVLAVGDDVTTVVVGDRVIVPFQISCGRCERCQRGLTGSCQTQGIGAMYGLEPFGGPWGGFLADLVRVPWADAMLLPLPAGIDPVSVASMSDNIPDAWRTIGPQLPDIPDPSVLIVGGSGPSIPFYAIGIAKALGATTISYADHDHDRLAKAERLGALPIEGYDDRPAGSFSLTVCSASDRDALVYALRSTEPDGTCTCNTIFFGGDVALPMLEMYTRGVRLVTGRVNARAAIPPALDLVARGRFEPAEVTDAVVDWDDAIAALIDGRRKVVLHRPADASPAGPGPGPG